MDNHQKQQFEKLISSFCNASSEAEGADYTSGYLSAVVTQMFSYLPESVQDQYKNMFQNATTKFTTNEKV